MRQVTILLLIVFLPGTAALLQAQETVKDYDGNTYKTIRIGSQTWMAENLKTTHYQNGDLIAKVNDRFTWSKLSTGAYCSYDNSPANANVYGYLYNWYAATDKRNIAPAGWHVPNDNDWNILINQLGGESAAGYKLKEKGIMHWLSPNTGANNESGFNGLPAGKRAGDAGGFWFLHNQFDCWSADELSVSSARSRPIEVNSYGCIWGYDDKRSGLSIRLVKDDKSVSPPVAVAPVNKKGPATTVTDYNGNVYTTVKIGTQVWMAENLKVKNYRNGDPIPNITEPGPWSKLSSGAYCSYNNSASNADVYGYLYNWFAATDQRNIAPAGWHVPTNDDWNILINYLGGEPVAASKMKETGVTHWLSPNSGATNESGYNGLPAGKRAGDAGGFWFLHNQLNWWSADELSVSSARSRPIEVNAYGCIWGYDDKRSGLSIRLVKD